MNVLSYLVFVHLWQLWLFDHFLIPKYDFGKSSTKFSRVLQWMDMKVAEDKITTTLNKNKICFIPSHYWIVYE